MAAGRFLCDAMLGRLARDLRLLGYDAAYEPRMEDTALLAKARAESRMLLTKDRQLAQRAGRDGLLVRAPTTEGELEQVVDELGLRPPRAAFLSRCGECGARLEAASAVEVAERVPPAVAAAHPRMLACPGCARVYWEGSHVERIRERLGRFLHDG